jgi:hypothetical protein
MKYLLLITFLFVGCKSPTGATDCPEMIFYSYASYQDVQTTIFLEGQTIRAFSGIQKGLIPGKTYKVCYDNGNITRIKPVN